MEGDVVLPLGDLGPRVEEDGGRVQDVEARAGRATTLLVVHEAADVGLVVHPGDLLDQDGVVDEALQLRALEEPAVAHLLGVGQGLAEHLEAVALPHHLLVHQDLHVWPEPHLHLQGQRGLALYWVTGGEIWTPIKIKHVFFKLFSIKIHFFCFFLYTYGNLI